MRNAADALLHTTRKSLLSHGDRLSASERESIEAAIVGVDAILQNGTQAELEPKIAALSSASIKLDELANSQQHSQEDAPTSAAAKQNDDVVDADFTEAR